MTSRSDLLRAIARNPLGLGTAPLGSRRDGPLWWGPQDRTTALATVIEAIAAGVAFIDTAPFYGWGLAEEIVGEALASIETQPPVLTKCGTVQLPDGGIGDDASPDAVRRDVEKSLERLRLDRIDVVQVHDPDPTTPIEATWEAVMGLRDEGLVDGGGLSNHPIGLMERALAVGPIDVVQQQYSALDQRARTDGVIAWCRDHDIPFLSWAPLASGFLVDDFDLGALHPDDLRHRLPWAGERAEFTEAVRDLLAPAARDLGIGLTEAALSFATIDPGTAAIVGARSPVEATALGHRPARLPAATIEALVASAEP